MPRPRKQPKPKPEAVILPPELDDEDAEEGSVMPDDDGWITLEQSGADPVAGTGVSPDKLVRRPAVRRQRSPRRDS